MLDAVYMNNCSVTTNIYRMVETNTKKSMRPVHAKKISDPIQQLDKVYHIKLPVHAMTAETAIISNQCRPYRLCSSHFFNRPLVRLHVSQYFTSHE